MPVIVAALSDMAVNAGIVGSAVLAARVYLFCHHFFKNVVAGK